MKNIAIITIENTTKSQINKKIISSILNITKNTNLPIITNELYLDRLLEEKNVKVDYSFSHIYNTNYTFKDTEGIIFITKSNDISGIEEYKLAKKLNIPIRIIKV